MSEPVRRTPASRMHASRGAVVVREAGWDLVERYGEVADERSMLATSVGVCDITARAKVDARGSIDGVLAAAGAGTIAAEVGPDWGVALGAPGAEDAMVSAMSARAGTGAMVTDATHLFAGYAVAGARVDDLLAQLTAWDHRRLTPGSATGASFGEARGIVVRRDLPIPVFEIFVATEFGRYTWETFVGAAERTGGGAVGWAALREEGWS
jgi:glycine cleavage system aminomethyltransferase T